MESELTRTTPIRLDAPVGEVATAPYNFVRLPRQILTAGAATQLSDVELLDVHNRFMAGRLHGHIGLDITALTPLYIRGRRRPTSAAWADREKTEARPAVDRNEVPIIPGSSLRGMTRSIVELLTFAKVPHPHDAKPFFRTVGTERVGVAYRNRMLKQGRPEGGILRHGDEGWFVDVREVVRVPHQLIANLGYRQHPNYHPNSQLQHQPCAVRIVDRKVVGYNANVDLTSGDWRRGTLVLTGSAPKKLAEFVFLDADGGAPLAPVPVSQAVMDRVTDDDQITPWQVAAFPSGKPKGTLVSGTPIFFIRASDGSGVEFLGRARMFRLPYDRSLKDLVPEHLRNADLDLTEAIFGTVGSAQNRPAVKGRVFFENARASGHKPAGGWTHEKMTPSILSGPKPTTYVHYLTQPATSDDERFTTFLAGDTTVPRGYKVYFHRSDDANADPLALARNQKPIPPNSKQHTSIEPVREGVTFKGRIRFENLLPLELGALLAAVELQPGCAHRIGMAKPLGLGSIRVTAHVTLTNPSDRYRTWSGTGALDETGRTAVVVDAREAFMTVALQHAKASGEPTVAGCDGLASLARFSELFTMLNWERRPPVAATAPLRLDPDNRINEFKDRRVLPDPFIAAGQTVEIIDHAGQPPSAARREADIDAERRNRRLPHRNSGPAPTRQQPRYEAQPLPTKPAALTGRRCEERTKKGGSVFVLSNGSKAVLHPSSKVPTEADLDGELTFEHAADGDRYIQVRWISPAAE